MIVIVDVCARVYAMLGLFLRCFGLLANKVTESAVEPRSMLCLEKETEIGVAWLHLLIVEVIHGWSSGRKDVRGGWFVIFCD